MEYNSFNVESLHDLIYNYVLVLRASPKLASFITFVLSVLILLVVYFVAKWTVFKILTKIAEKLVRKTPTKFDDLLLQNKTLNHLSKLIPLVIIIDLIPVMLQNYEIAMTFLAKLVDISLVLVWVMLFRSILRTVRDYLKGKESFKDKPLDSYLQVVNIFMFFIAGVILFTMLTGKSTMAFLGTLGAASAILMLVFKDTILGFVASIQVSTNDMVRIGDWIEMPKYGADGDVLEINLNTVKIQNWDKTITTVPTYYLITDSFKNWRGMQTSGGRRIKRAIHIKISTIRYLEKDEIVRLSQIQLLEKYIAERQQEIEAYNDKTKANKEMPVNGRNLTNVGLFREYITRYVNENPLINKDMTMLIRQLDPTETGLPIELYMFVSDVRWAIYEGVMSDIFDHLLAAIKHFELEVFELPASDDVRNLQLSAYTSSKE